MNWDDEGALEDYGAPNWSIWKELREVVSLWEDTYRDYWGHREVPPPERLSEEEARNAALSYEIAGAILKMIRALTLGGAAAPDKNINVTADTLKSLRKALRTQKQSPVVSDRISLELAKEYVNQIDGASDRAFRLLGVLQGRTITDRSADYLRRVVSLYVQGLELEAGVMCRAALEAALMSRLEAHIDADGTPPSLEQLLALSGRERILPGYEKANNRRGWRARPGSPLHSAEKVRRAGNFIMHDFLRYPDDDGAVRNAFECIRELAVVLATLFPPPTFEPAALNNRDDG